MGTETERKFLVRDESWRAGVVRRTHINQGYLSLDPARTVRVRTRDNLAFFGAKGLTVGIARPECEYEVSMADARQLFAMSLGNVQKHRHEVPYAGHTWEIDVFEEANAGLLVAEIELEHADEAFARPDWLGAEVSHNPAYFNSSLVLNPFMRWPSVLTTAQQAHVKKASPECRHDMTYYLRAGVDVNIYRQDENGPARVAPYAICVANTDFWVDCCETAGEAQELAQSLGLYVASVSE
ncbi:CYTH domain-containing protein [Paraburkholderia sp. EG287A]|uniref:CYTH domain-containing protein n=1 Tax=Paraburkholderia sp. EG287A TaxID=3237012 RepID=UPI0034D1E0A2